MASTSTAATTRDDDMLAWLVSFGVHALVLVALGAVGLGHLSEPQTVLEILTLPELPDSDEYEIPEVIGEQTKKYDEPVPQTDLVVNVDINPDPLVPPFPWPDPIPPPQPPVPPTNIEDSCVLPPPPSSVEVSATATGALDRLTKEILDSLEQRATVVCWVFDQSLSLSAQRQDIARRLGRIATEIEESPAAINNDLLNLVFAYGQQFTRVSPAPTREISHVSAAIRAIPVDDSGVEMTFKAIFGAASEAVACRKRRGGVGTLNIMVVAFTDEAGDDQHEADRVETFCRQNAVRVFVVGVPAPFGQSALQFKFKEFDERFADAEAWAEVCAGPESRCPEAVRILRGGPLDAPLDSGFGPFSLCKLCLGSSGSYFAVHPDRDRIGEVNRHDSAPMAAHLRAFFDPEVMRPYRPIYTSDFVIQKELKANAAKNALVLAAHETATSPLAGLSGQEMRFLATDQGRLIEELSHAQKKAANLEPQIEHLLEILERGRADRLKISADERRWRAGYDLALGRTLALKARTLGYMMMLAKAKAMTFADGRNNTWVLKPGEPAADAPLDSRVEKVVGDARRLLEQVVHEHPGTPWAMIAAEELHMPLSYSWHEAYTPPPPPVSQPGPSPTPQRPGDDENRTVPKPQPRVLPTKI